MRSRRSAGRQHPSCCRDETPAVEQQLTCLAAADWPQESRQQPHVGDGRLGREEAAPYDAIIVAAGGPTVPQPLKEQLAEGGRLVIPVGAVAADKCQPLLKITRTDPESCDEERISAVRFVPVIGAQGWTEDGRRAASSHVPAPAASPR